MQNGLDELDQLIKQFLDGEITADDVELKLKSINGLSLGDSTEYTVHTMPLNRKYHEVTGKGIVFDLSKSYPPRIECIICLCKAIENNKDVEEYYEEYWKNNTPKNVEITEKPDGVLY